MDAILKNILIYKPLHTIPISHNRRVWELHYLLNWLDDKIFLNKKEAENDLWSAASSKLSEQVEVQR